ncbi:MAG: hypothetical protein EDM70_04900 [Candidatus Brocadia sp. AMX2]|nr:MAG: hypothetical protein EDM70_04900 [Candidatus Brocadia sp. AMX2]
MKENFIVGSLDLINQGVAFVGDYSRYPTVQDKFYMHLVDPKTGMLNGNENLAVIATAPTAEEAGVLATVLFMNGTKDRKNLSTIFPNTGWLILSDKPQNSIVFQGSPGFLSLARVLVVPLAHDGRKQFLASDLCSSTNHHSV